MDWLNDTGGLALLASALAFIAWLRLRHGRRRRLRADPRAVHVRVNGRFEPDRIVVRAGEPVRLVFHREETAACSEHVVFRDFGVTAMLPPFQAVPVDLPAAPPGEHEFTCELGVLRGRLVYAPDRRRDIRGNHEGVQGGFYR